MKQNTMEELHWKKGLSQAFRNIMQIAWAPLSNKRPEPEASEPKATQDRSGKSSGRCVVAIVSI